VYRPYGPWSISLISLSGVCTGQLPQYVAKFNGQSSYIIANSKVFKGSSFTVSTWITLNAINAGHYQSFVASGTAGTVDLWFLLSTNVNTGLSNYYMAFFGDDLYRWENVFSANKWYFITAEWNNVTKVQQLFLNGSLNAGPRTSAGLLNTGTVNVCFGGGVSGCGGAGIGLDGLMTNIQIYNTSLSANEIQALYLKGIGGAPIDLQHIAGWWPLNGDANDYSGNDNNGVSSSVFFTTSWTSN